MKKIGSGKVRDIYDVGGDRILLVVSDRISAFDVIMPDAIPDKGKLLNQLSAFWFDFTRGVIPNHVISTDYREFPQEFQTEAFRGRSMLVKKLKILPIECIVRGYIAGSAWADYVKTGGVCGIALPGGLRESGKLPEPIFTPSTKAELGEHDENISFERARNLLGAELAENARQKTIEVYVKCADYALTKGIIIADTKLEFGLDEDGALVLGDEALTPDSSRFWATETYAPGRGQDSYDKQFLRDWLQQNGYRGTAPGRLPQAVIDTTRGKYVEAFEKLAGRRFL
jgi:phosphoribosylaminoimidazole-succinocarboxamide synthase